jgi:hypothetical protein
VIVLVAPGLYQVSMGFFAAKTECVKVYVNGEAIMTVKEKERKVPHSAGNVTGLTIVEFIALPARARVSISFDGEKPAEGFFCLRKL